MSLQKYTIPNVPTIFRLTEKNFALDTKDKICLYLDGCILALFYDETPLSKEFLDVFTKTSQVYTNAMFAICHMELEDSVLDGLMTIGMDYQHPLNWAAVRAFPFILIYRNGYPVNFYDGPPDYDIFLQFCAGFACREDFVHSNTELTQNVSTYLRDMYYLKEAKSYNGKKSIRAVPYEPPAKSYPLPSKR